MAFFESIKYTGHLFPIALLRVYLGYQFMQEGIIKAQGDYLNEPLLAGTVNNWLDRVDLPHWYQSLIQNMVIPYWQVFAYLVTTAELIIGVGFIIGFLVRPLSVLAGLIALNFIFIGDPSQELVNKMILSSTLALGWIGAGRCLGFDYFFFKRHRGIWW